MEENNSRRKFIQQSALLGVGIMLGSSTVLFAENNNLKKNKMTNTNSDTGKKVSFLSNNIKIAGNLYYPDNITFSNKTAQAVVVAHPGAGVKEQTAGLYAKRLAEKGFITLAFDAAYQGESEGTPRGFEDPTQRIEDIKSAVTFLGTLTEVDTTKIGVLGICASGGIHLWPLQPTITLKQLQLLVV